MIDWNNPFHILLLAWGIWCVMHRINAEQTPYDKEEGVRVEHLFWVMSEIGCIFMVLGVVMEILRMFS